MNIALYFLVVFHFSLLTFKSGVFITFDGIKILEKKCGNKIKNLKRRYHENLLQRVKEAILKFEKFTLTHLARSKNPILKFRHPFHFIATLRGNYVFFPGFSKNYNFAIGLKISYIYHNLTKIFLTTLKNQLTKANYWRKN